MVRRKRKEKDGLPIPRHLCLDMAWQDPLEWRRQRFEWPAFTNGLRGRSVSWLSLWRRGKRI